MTPLETAIQHAGNTSSLARALGVSPQAVHFWRSGERKINAEMCILIEQATDGLVRCEELLPDIPWSVLRSKPAPPASATQPESQEA